MVYLDYAANTPVDDDVLDEFVSATKKYIANPNSNHHEGVLAKNIIDDCSYFIANYFNSNKESIIYTSGSVEANNLVIKGVADRYKNKGKHIIISALEHSSIVAPCNFLTTFGYEVSVISITKEGIINLEELKQELRDDTILVSICSVDSELGTIQPIKEIAKIIKNYPNCIFHTDATQAIGKTEIDYSGVDFITFAPHKFYGLNGFGCLVNRKNIKITPLMHGGKSTTIYRSGTPVVAAVVALKYAFQKAVQNLKEREEYIKKLNHILREELKTCENIHINSPENSIYNTLNISLIGFDNIEVQQKLEQKQIYISTTTACSLGDSPSKSVMAITGDTNLASNTLRISLAYYTTEEEIKTFLEELFQIIKK